MLIPRWWTLVVWSALALAQETTFGTCHHGGNWWKPLVNSFDQDPCQVVRLMRQLCKEPGTATQPTSFHDPDFIQPKDGCLCKSTTFVTYGACLACQSTSPPATVPFTPTFANWTKECDTNQKTFALDVPIWSKDLGHIYDQDKNKPFDVGGVTEFARSGSSLSPALSNATDIATGTDALTVVVTATPLSDPNQQSSSSAPEGGKKSNIGPIVGGVIGGLLAVALVVATLLFLRKKRTKAVAPSSEFARFHQGPSLHPNSSSPDAAEFQGVSVGRSGGRSYTPLRQASGDESGGDDELPGFTPGTYIGPIYEKPGQYISDPNAPLYGSASQSQLTGQAPGRST